MANVVVEEQSLIDIASAIRTKNETDNTYKPSEMANAILDITTGGEVVEPVLQEKSVTPTTSSQTITPDTSYDGLSKVTVNAVTSAIDSDIKATNIRSGVNILGVTGSMKEYVAPKLQSKSATPKTTSQTIKPDSGYDGLSQVTISAVTSSIDSNITSSNIKSGVSILGVTGTLEAGGGGSGGITPTGAIFISENGIYDVTNYETAVVEVGSSGESCTVNLKITSSSSSYRPIVTYTTDMGGGFITTNRLNVTSNSLNSTITVVAGTEIHFVTSGSAGSITISCTGDIERVNNQMCESVGVCKVTGDGTITVSAMLAQGGSN